MERNAPWVARWQRQDIGFHATEVNPYLARYLDVIQPGSDSGSILVPLCGKSVDLAWLAQRGHRVVGVEVVEMAIEQFFDEQSLTPETTTTANGHRLFRAGPIEIICADFLKLTAHDVGVVGGIWDRAALVALAPDIRDPYARTLLELAGDAPILLNTFHYDQTRMEGPPFSVDETEVRRHFATRRVDILEHADVVDRIAFKEAGHQYWFSTLYSIRASSR